MKQKYTGTLIGFYFTIINIICIGTFIVPMIAILPTGSIIENLYSAYSYNYQQVGDSTLLTLLFIFFGTTLIYFLYLYFTRESKKQVSKRSIILFFIFQFFIVHALGFYIDLSSDWSRANDGQLVLEVGRMFPFSSMAFIVLGFLADVIKKTKVKV